MAPRTQAVTGEGARQASGPSGPPEIGEPGAAELSDLTIDEALARLSEAGVGPVSSATLMELAALGVDPRLSSLAASAMEMARQLDGRNSATAKSMCVGRLQEAMDRLLELNPPKSEDTPLDQLKARHTARISEATG